jgi:hypothetical protein
MQCQNPEDQNLNCHQHENHKSHINHLLYKGWYESNASSFFSVDVIVITMEFTWMIYTSVAVMRLFFHKVSVIFNTLLPTLSKMLYTSVVKFPASNLEHIMKTLFQFIVICKMVST